MSKNIMIGQKFGLLTVIADSGERLELKFDGYIDAIAVI